MKSTFQKLKEFSAGGFYPIVLSYAILVAFFHHVSLIGNSDLVLAMVFGGCLLAVQRFFFKQVVFNKILFYTSLSFLVYGVLQSPVFPVDQWQNEAIYFLSKFGFYIVLCAYFYKKGFCNLFSYILLVSFFIDSNLISEINNGITKTRTEFYSILESVLVLLLISSFFEREKAVPEDLNRTKEISASILVVYTVAHLANYWAAGFAKMNLDGGVFSWLSNETMANLKRAELWDLPMALYSQYILNFEYIKPVEILGNIFVYVAQALSIVVPLFPIILAPLTVVYDVFHIMVGLLAGVFFYKWIYVNILIMMNSGKIVAALKTYGFVKKASLCGLIMFMYFFSSVYHLGWYETRQGNLIHAYGIYEDGREVKLHTQFFGSGSFSILNKTNNTFSKDNLTQMGAISIGDVNLARSCEIPLRENAAYLKNRTELVDFAERFLEDRHWASKALIYIQPYHLLIPHWRNKNTLFGETVHAIRFELHNYCIDENYKVYKDDLVEAYTVTRSDDDR